MTDEVAGNIEHAAVRQSARRTLDQLRGELLAMRNDRGHWVGELAASALSTATAISALAAVMIHEGDASLGVTVRRGVGYLRMQQNDDGGFGDTDRSHSNIATSYLVAAASALATQSIGEGIGLEAKRRLDEYLTRSGSLEGLRARYGTDKTFVVPIMTNMAIAGLVSWDEIPALPFEAAVVPQSMYRMMRMPVVSYAIPALVAIGQARHFHGRRSLLPLRWLRTLSIPRTMRVLESMQPASGGYLEATPLTAFVVMSLAATGRGRHAVAKRGIEFLCASMDERGRWPIDTNLATWLTSLAVHGLACDPEDEGEWCSESLTRWHLECQHTAPHPFTGARPGGWGWTDLSGAVPDGDDTPAAILALLDQRRYVSAGVRSELDKRISLGLEWLVQLQNRDGGWPTFCRGWGKLPFDRSSTDLTAHAMRAISRLLREVPQENTRENVARRAIARGERFLVRQQRPTGEWLPLWFGNQDEPDDVNPIYGTARVLLSLESMQARREGGADASLRPITLAYGRAVVALIHSQNGDGGWGGGASVTEYWKRQRNASGEANADDPTDSFSSTVEETAIAVEGLVAVLAVARETPEMFAKMGVTGGKAALDTAIIRGVEFLLRRVDQGNHREPWPIGFYFAKLWYHEKLYPWVFAVAALGKYLRAVDDRA